MAEGTTFLTKKSANKPGMLCPVCLKRGDKHRMVVMVDQKDQKKRWLVCNYCQHKEPYQGT